MFKQTLSVTGVLWLIVLVFGSNGCGGGGSSTPVSNEPVTSVVKQTGDLQFTLTTSKATYAQGEVVPFTFTAKNVGTQTIAVLNQVDLLESTTISKGGQVVTVFPTNNDASFYNFKLAPGESNSKSDTWDQTDSNKKQVGLGQYTLSSVCPVGAVNETDFLQSIPPAQWNAFWQANYTTNPITVTIR